MRQQPQCGSGSLGEETTVPAKSDSKLETTSQKTIPRRPSRPQAFVLSMVPGTEQTIYPVKKLY